MKKVLIFSKKNAIIKTVKRDKQFKRKGEKTMTYFVNYINSDGSLYVADFSTKKKAQAFIYGNDIAIESVVKNTKKGDTEVTHLFDIPYFADSAETDTENSEEYLAEQEKLENEIAKAKLKKYLQCLGVIIVGIIVLFIYFKCG